MFVCFHQLHTMYYEAFSKCVIFVPETAFFVLETNIRRTLIGVNCAEICNLLIGVPVSLPATICK